MTEDNPYRLVGQMTLGDPFVGRAELLRKVQSCWRGQGRPGNLSVQGSHRMGKTSLVSRAAEIDGDSRENLLFVRLSVGDHESGTDLFRAVVRETHHELGSSSSPGAAPYRRVLDQLAMDVAKQTEWFELAEMVRTFFTYLGRSDMSVVVILDEFDRASQVFGRLADFQFLRTLASEAFSPIGLVTVSRRPIDVVEIDAVGGSTLDGVLSLRCNVGCFSDTDIDEMLGRAEQAGIDLRARKDEITHITGGHPYLLGLLCCEIVHRFHYSAIVDIRLAYSGLIPQFETQFKVLTRSLDAATGNRGKDLLRRVSQNRDDTIPAIDVDLMRRLGLLSPDVGRICLFSNKFAHFVQRLVQSGPE